MNPDEAYGNHRSSYCAVVIHFRAPNDAENVVRSLAEQSVRPQRIVVVDNSSREQPFMPPKGLEINIDIIAAPDNPGYGAAANIGIDHLVAQDNASRFVLLLTQDVLLEHCTAQQLLNAAVSEGAMCAAPTLFRARNRETVYSTGGVCRSAGGVGHRTDLPEPGELRDVDWADGAVLLLDVATRTELGGFWPGYFLYYEEVELCARIRGSGGRIIVVGDARAWQEPGNFTPYLRLRNQLLFAARVQGQGFVSACLHGFNQLVRTSAGRLLQADPVGAIWAVRGFIDGVRHRSGKPPLSFF